MSKVLIIDDDTTICRMMETMVRKQGHLALSSQTLDQGLHLLSREAVDLVFLDVNLPDGNGLDKIQQISHSPSHPEIIIMTGQGNPEGADLAIQSGAWDYLPKAASTGAIRLSLLRVLEYRSVKKPAGPAIPINHRGIIGTSRCINKALDQIAQTIGSDAGVLITGETGTGKELFAQAVHRNSTRKTGNFVVVDCAALPNTLVESMLFGHLKGAFTGADAPRDGLIKQADGGTLFLDEIGEMPLELQKAFLRVLESHSCRPIGGKHEIVSNFRVISSTNRDLDEMVRQVQFRKDLLYRLRTFHIKLPSLRERKDDLEDLAVFHSDRLNALYGWPAKKLAPGFLDLLQSHDWPGNVRELVNVMDCAVTAAQHDPALFPCHLPKHLRAAVARARVTQKRSPAPLAVIDLAQNKGAFPLLQNFREATVEKAEVSYLKSLMSTSDGSMNKACLLSGVSRSRLYELLKKHAIAAC